MGGKQFWADQLVFRDWRIQRNVWTGHHRLLDERNFRRAWGSFEACRHALERFRRERNIPAMRGRVVLVLHGLVRTRTSLNPLCEQLKSELPDTDVLRVGYPSTRASIADHAHSLARVIDQLGPEVTQIDFVAHSMGNLVIRHYLGDHADPAGCGPDPRIRRMVMIAPPNHGSRRAEIVDRQRVVQDGAGNSGPGNRRLEGPPRPDWPRLVASSAFWPAPRGTAAAGRNICPATMTAR